MFLIKLLILMAFLLMLSAAIALYNQDKEEPTPFIGFLIFLINGCIYIIAIGAIVLVMLQMIFN